MRVTSTAVLVFALSSAISFAQPAASSEVTTLAHGWALLARGDTAKASEAAADLLKRFPRSGAVLALAVEAEIARAGSGAGLAVYERWLGKKRIEEVYALRRVALALLREIVRNHKSSLFWSRAVDALIAEGDTELPLKTDDTAAPMDVREAALHAELGSDRAVDSLIEALNGPTAIKVHAISGLTKTQKPRAVQSLMKVLSDQDPLARAAAATALGKMRATEAIPALKPLLNDPVFNVHLSAAGALLALKDTTGLPWLQDLRASEHAGVRLAAVQVSNPDMDARWLDTVRALTKEDDPEVRRQAAVLLAPHDPEEAKATLELLMQDPNPAQREAATSSYLQSVVNDFTALRGFLRANDAGARVQAAARILELTR